MYNDNNFNIIFESIDSLMKSGSVIVAIDGNSGSGKSSLASLIQSKYDCNIFHMDHFFLRPELKTKERLKEAGGNIDYVRFKEEVIDGLVSKSKFQYQKYNCVSMSLEEVVTVIPKKLNIVEGVYSMHPMLSAYYDLKIFLYTDEEEQEQRILKRNGPSMQKRFIEEWIPLENKYFKELKICEQCDLIING